MDTDVFFENIPRYAGIYSDKGVTEDQIECLEEEYDEVILEKGILLLISDKPEFQEVKNANYLSTSVIFDQFNTDQEAEEIIERYAPEERYSISEWWERIKEDRELCMIL